MGNKISIIAAIAFGLWASQLSAAPILCSVSNASANGEVADDCAGDDAIGANPTSEKDFVNGEWDSDGTFSYIGKYDETAGAFDPGSADLAGFSLTVGEPGDGFSFYYTLAVPSEYVGKTVDWVLGVKQASGSSGGSFISYLFEDVTLGIDGGFNSFFINPGGNTSIAYSHASGFIRTSSVEVPEPGTLALLGLGLAGLGMARRRKAFPKH